jgi:hypothetical protein
MIGFGRSSKIGDKNWGPNTLQYMATNDFLKIGSLVSHGVFQLRKLPTSQTESDLCPPPSVRHLQPPTFSPPLFFHTPHPPALFNSILFLGTSVPTCGFNKCNSIQFNHLPPPSTVPPKTKTGGFNRFNRHPIQPPPRFNRFNRFN